MDSIYELTVKKQNGEFQSLAEYKEKVLLIVNTASKCGFSNQFKALQQLYEEYSDQGFVVLGFPSDNFNDQEYEDIKKTMEFCQLNYGVTFPMFSKVDVIGEKIDPLFKFLTSNKKGLLTEGIKWNFTKFLINKKGQVIERIAPQTSPLKMGKKIGKLVQ